MGKNIRELQVGDKVTRWSGGGYGRSECITGIHTITKITKTSITTEDGRRYNHGGSEWGSSRGTLGSRGAFIEPYREEHDAILVAHRESNERCPGCGEPYKHAGTRRFLLSDDMDSSHFPEMCAVAAACWELDYALSLLGIPPDSKERISLGWTDWDPYTPEVVIEMALERRK